MTIKELSKRLSNAAAGIATWVTLKSYLDSNNNSINQKKMQDKINNIEERVTEVQNTLNDLKNNNSIYSDKISNLTESLKNYINRLQESVKKTNEISNELKNNNLNKEQIEQHLNNINNCINDTSSNLDKTKSILDQLGNFSDKFNNISNSNNFVSDILNDYKEYLSTLTVIEQGALGHLLASIFLFLCLTNIMSIIYGDLLIRYLKLEEKFPKLAKYIQLRRKFQQYYLFLNFILIISTLLLIFYVNASIFFKL